MTNPDLILLDEATEGMAPLVAQEIWKTLDIIRSEGIATIVVDKDHRSLAKVADRMWVMAKGRSPSTARRSSLRPIRPFTKSISASEPCPSSRQARPGCSS